jgi:hypothetical protein
MQIRVILVVLLAAAAQGQPGKASWNWSIEERLEARFDVQQRAKRVSRHIEHQRGKNAIAPTSAASLGDVIDGKVNPELFLPTELFRALVFSGFVTQPKFYPLGVRQTSDDLFLAEAEWDELRDLVREYAANLEQERDLIAESTAADVTRKKAISAEIEKLRLQQCAASAAALRRARAQYGVERFNRFLYTVVARPITRFVAHVDSDPETIATLRRKEEACQ